MPDSDIGFFVHRGSRSGAFLRSFVSEIHGAEPSWRVGVALHLPRGLDGYQRDLAQSLESDAAYVLADPETRVMHLPYDERGRGRADFAYLSESDPAANRRRFTEQVLKAQVDNGRDVLISPWLVHNLSGTTRELLATAAFATLAGTSPQRGSRKLLLGFEATEDVISAAATRNNFLNELVEAPENPIYLRLTTGAAAGSNQYAHEQALKGLRKVAESLSDNGRVLFLPQSGLAGWLMLGFGALAFGAGPQWSMQRSQALRSGGTFGATPLNWYFWPQFLGFVLADEIAQLTAVPGAQTCTCPYCRHTPPQAGAAYDREAAEKHFLWWCANLAQEVRAASAATRAQVIRDRVAAAESFWGAALTAGVALDPRSQPQHLATWSRVVA